MSSTVLKRGLAAGAAALAVAAGALLPATAASAAPPATGWVRVAHFSPDTKPVDVTLYALSGGQVEFSLKDVAYGAVSKYVHLADGYYVVAMQPAGSSSSTTPIVKQTVQVTDDSAKTVAVFGRNAALRSTVLPDDLSTPKQGTARVRVIQASTAGHAVSVSTEGGPTIASGAADGTVTSYATVPAQTWHLAVASSGATTGSTVALKNGEIVSLVVLDTPGGGLTVRPIVDSATVGAQPKGFLATGGGFLAHQAEAQQRTAAGAGGLAAVLVVGAGAVAVRRRRRALV